jgi:hypothetical protein
LQKLKLGHSCQALVFAGEGFSSITKEIPSPAKTKDLPKGASPGFRFLPLKGGGKKERHEKNLHRHFGFIIDGLRRRLECAGDA